MLKIAGIQMECSTDREKNLKKAIELLELAFENNASIICFQELFQTFWFPFQTSPVHFQLAETEDDKTLTLLKDMTKGKDVTLVCPIFERDEDEYYNTAFIISKGEIIGKYRKIHIPNLSLWQEKYYFKPGNLGFPVFTTPYARIGIQICWDNFFPEGTRILALKGAEIIFAPTACAFASHKKWERAIAANAHMNGVFIIRVNRVGREERQHFYGNTFCVAPDGELLSEPSGFHEGIVLFDIDLREIKKIRKEWSFLRDRRNETYREIVEDLQD